MPSLGETTAMLKRLRRRSKADGTPLTGSRGRMAETAVFGANPGALRMLSHVPDALAQGAPLVVVLHGCGQTAGAYAADSGWLALADRYGFVVVAADQSADNNPNRCFNWFSPGDTARGQGEAASIASMARHAINAHGLDPDRVFVTGLSAGGAMTAVMLATYPELFAGGAIIAGLPYGVASNVGQALQAMRGPDGRTPPELGALVRGAAPLGGRIPRLSIWHGTADHTVAPANADAIAAQWAWTHGVSPTPDETHQAPGRSRAIWRSPETGEILIERHLLSGLGHGTPLATGGPDGVGSVAPFMLEAGVSASLESLRFWGLAPESADFVDATAAAEPAEAADASGVGEVVMRSLSGHVSRTVQEVISKALKSAGLLR